jgi:transcriptional regulator with XRE-family HTH domain
VKVQHNWGPLLRRERELHGYSFEELADELSRVDPSLNVERTTAWRWEQTGSNGRRPRPRYVRALCKLYQKSPASLGLITEAETPDPSRSEDAHTHIHGTDEAADGRQSLSLLAPRGFTSATDIAPHPLRAMLARAAAEPPERVDPPRRPTDATAADLESLAYAYRRAYGETAVGELLPRAQGLLLLATDLRSAARTVPLQRRLANVAGQAALLSGVLSVMGHNDSRLAESYYQVALAAAQDGGDRDLGTYVLGSLSFCDAHAGELSAGLQRIEQAHALAASGATNTTRAWLAALESELHARNGDELSALQSLEQAQAALARSPASESPWMGVGAFDEAKLAGYEGGNLVLLHRPKEAEAALTRSLILLPPFRLKHRATALADLAAALAHPQRAEIEEACRRASQALAIAMRLQHIESVQRVCRVYRRLRPWHRHPAVKSLGEELMLLV